MKTFQQSRSVEAILARYALTGDPALVLLGKIINGADTDNSLWNQPEGPGLKAIATGFGALGFADNHETLAHESIVYDALYAYCQEMAPGEARRGIQGLAWPGNAWRSLGGTASRRQAGAR